MWIGIQSLDRTDPLFTMVVPGLALLHIDLWARFRGTFKECTDLYIRQQNTVFRRTKYINELKLNILFI